MFELPPPREVQIGWVFCWLMLGSSQFEKTNMFTRCVGITLHMINIRNSKQTNKKLTQDQPPTGFFKQKSRGRSGPRNHFFHPHFTNWVFPKIMGKKNKIIPFVHRVFHHLHHPFGGFSHPYFWFNTQLDLDLFKLKSLEKHWFWDSSPSFELNVYPAVN